MQLVFVVNSDILRMLNDRNISVGCFDYDLVVACMSELLFVDVCSKQVRQHMTSCTI